MSYCLNTFCMAILQYLRIADADADSDAAEVSVGSGAGNLNRYVS
jgi:hypothetical protein